MRYLRFGLLFFLMSINNPLWSQQAQDALAATTLPDATKDPQAISIVERTLAAAGGTQKILANLDYVGTGNITKYADTATAVQGTVTVRGQGLNRFRMDTILPAGTRSEVTNIHTTIKDENNAVINLRMQSPLAPARLIVPYLQLWASLHSKNLNLLYKGTVESNSRATQHIQIQHLLHGDASQDRLLMDSLSVDFFIDSSTSQVVMMQDHLSRNIDRRIEYSNFTDIDGVLVPFTIDESIRGQHIWSIQLDQIKFNPGLLDKDFQLK